MRTARTMRNDLTNRKKRLSALTALTALVLGGILLWPPASTSGHHSALARSFGSAAAGSYLVEGELLSLLNPAAPPVPFKWLITLASDGTFAGDNTTDFGADTMPRFRSTQRGAWQFSGPHEVVATSLSFDYGKEETGAIFGTPENRLSSIPRVTMTMVFERRFERLRLQGIVEIFLPDQDPLDPDEEPVVVPLELQGEGSRITAR